MKTIELLFERLMWNSRYSVLFPVIFCVLIALGLFIVATVDALLLVGQMFSYFDPALAEDARNTLRIDTISGVVGTLDVYLIAALMLLVAFGLYELFINKIDPIENSEMASRLLLIRSFDDLKDRLANVVQVILIVKFFQQALALKYESVLDLLLLGIGIALIGAALFFTRKQAVRSYDVPDGKSQG